MSNQKKKTWRTKSWQGEGEKKKAMARRKFRLKGQGLKQLEIEGGLRTRSAWRGQERSYRYREVKRKAETVQEGGADHREEVSYCLDRLRSQLWEEQSPGTSAGDGTMLLHHQGAVWSCIHYSSFRSWPKPNPNHTFLSQCRSFTDALRWHLTFKAVAMFSETDSIIKSMLDFEALWFSGRILTSQEYVGFFP